jgi:signal transduction histidine kinase
VRLVNDVLDIEKIEAGRMEFRSSLDLEAPLERSVALVCPHGEARDVGFRPSPPRGAREPTRTA